MLFLFQPQACRGETASIYIYIVTEKGTIADDQRKANEHNRFFASTNKANKLTEEDKKLLKDLKAKEKVPFVQTKTFGENLTLSELN